MLWLNMSAQIEAHGLTVAEAIHRFLIAFLLMQALLLYLPQLSSVAAAAPLKNMIVKVNETGALYLLQSTGIRQRVPDAHTLNAVLLGAIEQRHSQKQEHHNQTRLSKDDHIRLKREAMENVPTVPEKVLTIFEEKPMPSLVPKDKYPDEAMRVFIQYFEIVNYPHYWIDTKLFRNYFNGAVVRWQNATLLCYRGGPSYYSHLRFSWMSDDFSSVDLEREYLGIRGRDETKYVREATHTQEDPRMLVLSNGTLVVMYVACRGDCGPIFNTTIAYTMLTFNKTSGKVDFSDSVYLDVEPYMKPSDHHYVNGKASIKQKNWVPFEYNHTLYFATHLYPMQVVEVIGKDSNNIGQLLWLTQVAVAPPIPWHRKFGLPIRGGTAAILVRGVYLAFFHTTSAALGKLTYFMGAMTFCAQPPFNLLSISNVPIAKTFLYDGKWTNGGVYYVIFPQGIQLSEDNEHVFLSLGHNDVDMYVLKFRLNELLESLEEVSKCTQR